MQNEPNSHSGNKTTGSPTAKAYRIAGCLCKYVIDRLVYKFEKYIAKSGQHIACRAIDFVPLLPCKFNFGRLADIFQAFRVCCAYNRLYFGGMP